MDEEGRGVKHSKRVKVKIRGKGKASENRRGVRGAREKEVKEHEGRECSR